MTARPEDSDSPRQSPVISIWGERIALGPVDRAMVPRFARWENDALVAHLSGDPVRPTPIEAAATMFMPAATTAPATRVRFALYERSTMRLIGIADLGRIDHAHGTAEFGITIGEPDCWGKGYGTEATRQILTYGFQTLGLRSIMLQVYDYNRRGIHAYRRAGFREAGRRRAAQRGGGGVTDVIVMECLAADFLPDGGGP